MNDTKNFLLDFLSPENNPISITEFVINLLITAILSGILGIVFIRYGNSLSNRKALAGTLLLISLTTMLIITIVKSSLALSLGLVGALSIVRFRTAIKEPEELAFFFISISIGLGMGASQVMVTVAGTIFLFLLIFLRRHSRSKEVIQNLSLTIVDPKKDFDYQGIVKTLGKYSSQVELKRFDENENSVELSLFVRFKNFDDLIESKKEIQGMYKGIQFSYLENI